MSLSSTIAKHIFATILTFSIVWVLLSAAALVGVVRSHNNALTVDKVKVELDRALESYSELVDG